MVFPLNQILNISLNLQIAIYLKDYSSLPYFFFDDVEEHQFPLKLQLHDAIYQLRFYSNSLIHILSFSNSDNNLASIQKN